MCLYRFFSLNALTSYPTTTIMLIVLNFLCRQVLPCVDVSWQIAVLMLLSLCLLIHFSILRGSSATSDSFTQSLLSIMVPGALILHGSCLKWRGTFTLSTFPPPREKLWHLHALSSPLSLPKILSLCLLLLLASVCSVCPFSYLGKKLQQ